MQKIHIVTVYESTYISNKIGLIQGNVFSSEYIINVYTYIVLLDRI